MKKILLCFMMLCLCACQVSTDKQEDPMVTEDQVDTHRNTLVIYYTMPESDGVDMSSSASRVTSEGNLYGATEYVARIMSEELDADLYRIETEDDYPATHEALIEQASQEKARAYRPKLKEVDIDLKDYIDIYIGYPNWWADLPMAMYSFIEQNDLSHASVRIFNTHGGSGLSRTVESLLNRQPDLNLVESYLSISRNDVLESRQSIINWLNEVKS